MDIFFSVFLPLIVMAVSLIFSYFANKKSFTGTSVAAAASLAAITAVGTLSFKLNSELEGIRTVAKFIGEEEIVVDFRQLQQFESELKTDGNEYLRGLLNDNVSDFRKGVDLAINEGVVVVPSDRLSSAAIQLFSEAKTRVIATSFVQPDEWWLEPWGKRYLLENEKVIERNVVVERIFIFPDSGALERYAGILKCNSEIGVIVSYILEENVGRTVSKDVIVVDNRLAGQLDLDGGRGIESVIFSSNREMITENNDYFSNLSAASEKYDGSFGVCEEISTKVEPK